MSASEIVQPLAPALVQAVAAAPSPERPPVPVIYSRVTPPATFGLLGRLFSFAIATGALGVLLLAAALPPDPHGTGTHTALGLQPCAFFTRTGLPCPTCGCTTSFAFFAHGNFLASFFVQPFGWLLAVLTAAAVWVGFYSALSGRPVYRLLRFVSSRYTLMPLLAWGLLAWGWKIFLTLRGLDGWR